MHDTLYAGGFRLIDGSLSDHYAVYRGKGLYLRFVNNKVQIACAKEFDRWANSVDFEVSFVPKNILRVTYEARKIIRGRGTDAFGGFGSAESLDYIAERI